MGPEEKVAFRCKRTVVSTRAVEPGKFHRLSVLDRAMESASLRLVFYYRRFPSEAVGHGGGTITTTSRLRESLSEVLSGYPTVTGRLLRAPSPAGQWTVKCNDAGVRMVEATARGTVEEWLERADREQEMKLVYWEDMFYKSYFWSTFYVQLTEFEGGGLAIGLSCSHMLADAASATMLVKAWADVTLLGKMLSPPYFHPLPPRRIANTPPPPTPHREPYLDLIDHYKNSSSLSTTTTTTEASSDSSNFATVTFAFTDDMVRSCTEAAGAAATPFEALAALLWVSVSRVKRRGRLVDMSVCVDVRGALNLSRSFFGNAMVFNGVRRDEEEGGEGRLEGAARAIREVVERTETNGAVMDLIEWLEGEDEKRIDGPQPPPPPPPPAMLHGGPQLLCANWEGLDAYRSTFEHRVRPIRVSYYLERAIGDGQILILPSPDGVGEEGDLSRVAMVTLPGDQVDRLCEEALILRFSPSILMGPRPEGEEEEEARVRDETCMLSEEDIHIGL